MTPGDGRAVVERMLDEAGIRINGDRPCDPTVHHDRFYDRVLSEGSLALGESYMDGWWDCDALDRFFDRLFRAHLDEKARSPRNFWAAFLAGLRIPQSSRKAFEIGRRHYDTGNRLFQAMLDKWMNYSCGYWKEANSLDEAQEAKLDLICRKMSITPGMRVLDIGCGWGGFAKYAAQRYGAEVTGITVSRQQVEFAREFCRGLPVEIEYLDYRDLKGSFDRVVSIGMFEHVGVRTYRTFMRVVQHCLKPTGLFLLHTIGGNRSVDSIDQWMGKYIFPNSMLPSVKQIATATEDLFTIQDWHSFGEDYDRTLMAWHENFCRGWDRLRQLYDERFFRMWRYYLLSCAGAFRAGRNQLWQIVFAHFDVPCSCPRIR
ncbi:MAG: cyclopropane fatty acyl phospholipid synthase [Acidobacteriota bacterium]|nr:MAG: cyclopropane fatty acyl phospholipid synthase [Acidobacteriota bacterium]